MSKFQIIILSVFVLFIIIGVAAFATYKGANTQTQLPPISVWGTFPSNYFNDYITNLNNTLVNTVTINYKQISQEQFSDEFVKALAKGQGPDAILVTTDLLLPHSDKLALVPFSVVSQRSFMDTYIRQASLYINANGIMALPFTVDPLVMYWNRDSFDSSGIATYPKTWDELSSLIPKLTVKDQNGNVRKSAIALGDFSNIDNAREILGTLLLQSGNPVTQFTQDGIYDSTFSASEAGNISPALQFFVQFADPSSVAYSWNKSLPNSKSAFLAGSLATYFGFASELKGMREKNPNLNFDVALMPQARGGAVKSVYAKMYGLSLVRSSSRLDAAFQILTTISQPQYLSELSARLYLPSVRRDVIAKGNDDPYITLFNEAALVSNSWLDVDPQQSRRIMSNMIESISSGRKTVYQSIQDAGDEYDILLRKATQ